MAGGAGSDEDAAVSVGVGVGAGAAPEAAAASRCVRAACPPRRSRPVGIKMFLTADEQVAIADAKSAQPKHTVAHVTGNSSGSAAGVVLLAEQRVQTREACRQPNRVLLIQRAAAEGDGDGDGTASSLGGSAPGSHTVCGPGAHSVPGVGTQSVPGVGMGTHSVSGVGTQSVPGAGTGAQSVPGAGAGTHAVPGAGTGAQSAPGAGRGGRAPCQSIARPRPPCPRRVRHLTEPPLPLASLARGEPPGKAAAAPPPAPAGGGRALVAPPRSASLEACPCPSADVGAVHTPPVLQVEEWCGPDSQDQQEDAGRRPSGRIEVSLYSGGSQREDILSVSVEAEEEEPAMVRGCGVRKTAPPVSVCRPAPSAGEATAGDHKIGREVGAAGRLVTRVDPRGRRELWWVSAAPPASPTPTPTPTAGAAARSGLSEELRGLLSFRRARRLAQQQQQQLARRRVVAAADRRQWPAVLLTFERGVSPEPGCAPPSPHALLAARKARIEVAAV